MPSPTAEKNTGSSKMKKWIITACLASLLSAGIHFYLARRAYQLQAGKAEESRICRISEQISCDPALLSPYSRIFGVSVSSWGFACNLFLTLFLGLFLTGFLGINSFRQNFCFSLSAVILTASVIMGIFSLVENLVCPLCGLTYLLSALTSGALFPAFRKSLSLKAAGDLFREKASYALTGLIAAAALFTHIGFVMSFDIKSLSKETSSAFIDWQSAPPVSFQTSPLFQMGPPDSRMILVEFADFLCPHCQTVSPVIHRFLKTHRDVSFHFYSYPLDPSCNPEIKPGKSGLSCHLTKTLICGESQQKGKLVHNLIFERQERFISAVGQEEKTDELINEIVQKAQLNPQDFTACMKSRETEEALKQTVTEGNKAQIPGTPSFFINGKLWRGRGNLSFSLQTLYDHLH